MAESKHWQLETDADRVAFLSLDKAGTSANTLSSDVLRELDARLAELERALPRAVVVASAKSSGFVAGAVLVKLFVPARPAYQVV